MHEVQRRQGVDVQTLAQLAAHVAGGGRQAFDGLLDLLRAVLEHGEEDLRVRVVGRDLHFGDGDHADPWVFQLVGDDFGQIALDLVRDALTALRDGFTVFCHDSVLLSINGKWTGAAAPVHSPSPTVRNDYSVRAIS